MMIKIAVRKGKKPSTWCSLMMSMVSFFLATAMLVGTTFAWFTMQTDSARNLIEAGTLKVELTHTNATETDKSVSSTTELFKIPYWEPGMMTYENLTVKNAGEMALKYRLTLNVYAYNYYVTTDSTMKSLLDVIKVCVVDGGLTDLDEDSAIDRDDADAAINDTANSVFTMREWIKNGSLVPEGNTDGVSSETFGIILFWESGETDSDYNVVLVPDFDAGEHIFGTPTEDGQAAIDRNHLFIETGISLFATQLRYEEDAFDNTYDDGIELLALPEIGAKASKTVEVPVDAKTTGMTVRTEFAEVKIPGDLIDDDASKYRLDVERIKNLEEGDVGAVTAEVGNSLVTYDVKLVKISSTNVETPVSSTDDSKVYTVTLFVGANCDLVKLYHKGVEITGFTYHALSGEVTYKTKSFSPYAAEIMFAGGTGTEQYPYLIANREQFEKMTTLYSVGYKYYEVVPSSPEWAFIDEDGNPHMDGSNWKLISGDNNRQRPATDFWGSIDCKGLVVDNLDCTLFKHLGVWDPTETHEKGITTVKNLTVNRVSDNGSTFGAYDYSAGIARDCGNWIELDNVNVHGTIEGSSAASFIDFGAGNMSPNGAAATIFHIDFNNCYSDATVCGTSGAAAGFMVNTYASNPSCENGIVYTVRDSVFDGILLSTQNHATNFDIGENYSVNAGSYFANNTQGVGSGYDQVVKFCYSDAFLAKHGNDFVGKQYVCQATKHSGEEWGAEVGQETVDGVSYTTYTYKCHHSISTIFHYVAKDESENLKWGKYNMVAGTLPAEKGESFTVTGCENSDHAVAYYYYALNPGFITYAAASESLTNEEGNYTTDAVRYADFKLVKTGTAGLSQDKKTFTVVSDEATDLPYAGARLVEYDADNNIVCVTTWTFPMA